jgi:hypothetical protein
MDILKRESLNRSLLRLGRAAAPDTCCPDVFVRNELAIAVRRFGWWAIAKTIVQQLRDARRLERRMESYYGS